MQYCNHPKVQIAKGKVKREILKIPMIKEIHERHYRMNVQRYSNCLRKISSRDANWVRMLNDVLLIKTGPEELSIPSTKAILRSANSLVKRLETYSHYYKHFVKLPQILLLEYPEIFLWGLEERLLNIAENYIGLPVHYHGSTLSINLANENGNEVDVRQWHIDPEDYRVLKIIIYLTDVDIGSGPFEYISKDLSEKAIHRLKYTSGFIAEDIFNDRAVPRQDWKACTGPKNTILIADTGRLFHRAKPASTTDRYALTYTYTSRQPKGLSRMWNYTPEWINLIESKVNSLQAQYLYL